MTAPSLREAVARAIAKAELGYEAIPARYRYAQADAALAVALPLIVAQCREHYAGVVEAWAAEVERKAPQSVTIVQARMHASHIRADGGPQ